MRTKQSPTTIAIFFILATIPLLFGSRHPVIQGGYTSFILIACGIWTIRNFELIKPQVTDRSYLVPYLLILFIFVTSMPLPFFLLEILSPVRADFTEEAVNLAQLDGTVTSLSYFAAETRFFSVYLLGLMLYYFCLLTFIRRKTSRHIVLWIFMIIGSFEAVYGLMQATNPGMGVLWLPSTISAEGCARGTIIYRNQYAAFLNMCWPMAVVLGILLYQPVMTGFQTLKQKKKTVSAADRLSLLFQKAALPFWSAGFMILAVLFSRSRGGILVMLLMVVSLLLILPFSRKLKTSASAVLILFIMLYGGMIGFQSVVDRFMAFYQGAQGRVLVWLDSLHMLKDHLVTGTGLGTYKFLSPFYMKNVSDNVWLDFAHNEYLEFSIELGLPMAIIFFSWILWQLCSSGTKVIQSAMTADTFIMFREKSVIAVGSFCAITGFLVHGFVDFIWHLPANALYAVTVAALLSTAFTSGEENDN